MTGGAKHERSGTEARPEGRQADGDRWGAAWVRRHRMALGGSRLCSSPSIRGAGDAVALGDLRSNHTGSRPESQAVLPTPSRQAASFPSAYSARFMGQFSGSEPRFSTE